MARNAFTANMSRTLPVLISGILFTSLAAATTAGNLWIDPSRIVVKEGPLNNTKNSNTDGSPPLGRATLPTVRSSPRHPHHSSADIYLSAVRTQVFADRDRDGYFSGFNLSLDVDTDHGSADVYATVLLARPGAVFEPLLTSNIFHVDGFSAHDTYHIEIELRRQFPADHYDIRIDIHDAYSNAIVDQVTPLEFRNLGALPLEAEPAHLPPAYPQHQPAHDGDYVAVEYAGSTGFAMALAIGGLALFRRYHRR